MLINQVSTRANEVLGTSGLVPALGEAWAHMCNIQVSLEWRDGVRLAAHASPPSPKVASPGGAVCCHRRRHPICRPELKAGVEGAEPEIIVYDRDELLLAKLGCGARGGGGAQ